jgi:hypothetical protein
MLMVVAAFATVVNVAWFSIWYHRTHEAGMLILRALRLNLISAGGLATLANVSAPVGESTERLRRLPPLSGMSIEIGGYGFRVPPRTTRVRLGILCHGRPPVMGPATFRGPDGVWHECRPLATNGKYFAVPRGLVDIGIGWTGRGGWTQSLRYLVPGGTKRVMIPASRHSSVFVVLVNTPHWHLFIGRGGGYPRATLNTFMSKPDYRAGIYTGFSMARWCRVLGQFRVEPTAARALMREIIARHLDSETDLRLEEGILRATSGRLADRTKLESAVWAAIELQLRATQSAGRVTWLHLPGGRTMVFCGLEVFVFDRAGRATIEGQASWRKQFLPAEIKRVVVPFFAQRAPPGLWRKWPRPR